MIKIILYCIFCGLIALGVYVYKVAPEPVDQSIEDKIAIHGLKTYLNEVGASESDSICWLGDPKSRILKQYLGAGVGIFDRLREKLKIKSWVVSSSCLDKEYKAIVVLFPFLKDIYEISEEESKKLQSEMSEVLSFTGRAQGLIRHNNSFQFQNGATIIILSKKGPALQTVTNSN
jgi:hypothetical protein